MIVDIIAPIIKLNPASIIKEFGVMSNMVELLKRKSRDARITKGEKNESYRQCLSCKYWEPAHKSYFGFSIGGGCKAGYCKKRGIKK